MDLSKAPKQFCENINIAFSDEFFAMAITSGNAASVFALTPAHAKRLIQMLSHKILEYEKQFGEIKTEWKNKIVSPIQFSDIKNSRREDEEEM